MDIYAPIAQRLGISKIKMELDDLSLKIPAAGCVLRSGRKDQSEEKRTAGFCQRRLWNEVTQHMEDAGIQAQVDGQDQAFLQHL